VVPAGEPPVTARKRASPPYSAMCSRIQRIASFTSMMCSGNVARGEDQ
jgi:hypothetical protein